MRIKHEIICRGTLINASIPQTVMCVIDREPDIWQKQMDKLKFHVIIEQVVYKRCMGVESQSLCQVGVVSVWCWKSVL